MNIINIIEKKKNNQALSKEEIEFFVKEYTNGSIPDYQMSALLMSIVLNGMNNEEVVHLTLAMANSGERMNLDIFENTVDKHSTGGVGDKTTLIVAPIVACLGCNVAKMSGRGLGYTGGTIDKLESIPGFQVQMEESRFINQINQFHLGLISQTKNIAPADKKIYALRDVTATVESIPLIASSIMSKKIASGAKNLVLDVKVGSGAFMKNREDAKELAKTMVDIGNMCEINTIAILTNMNKPLGNKIGNALEVEEAIEVLQGEGPSDLKEITIELASHMVEITKNISYEEAKQQVLMVLENGQAYDKFLEFVKCQDGNLMVFKNNPKYTYPILSPKTGYIQKMDTEEIGKVSCELGAGRKHKDDIIDMTAGITLLKKTGDHVETGEEIAYLYTSQEINKEDVISAYLKAITIADEKPACQNIILEIIR